MRPQFPSWFPPSGAVLRSRCADSTAARPKGVIGLGTTTGASLCRPAGRAPRAGGRHGMSFVICEPGSPYMSGGTSRVG